jgi:hypothetical protein
MPKRAPLIVPALLFAVAIVASLSAGFWLVAAIWLPAALVVLALRQLLLGRSRWLWLTVLLAVVVSCPILAFEGGFFVLPAAIALLLADARRGGQARKPGITPSL